MGRMGLSKSIMLRWVRSKVKSIGVWTSYFLVINLLIVKLTTPTISVCSKYKKEYNDNSAIIEFSPCGLSEKVAHPKHAIIAPSTIKEHPT
jgi:hypothetical protein